MTTERNAQGVGEFADLRLFYGVGTDAELIRAQAQHVERLQEKLLRNDQPAFTKPRFA